MWTIEGGKDRRKTYCDRKSEICLRIFDTEKRRNLNLEIKFRNNLRIFGGRNLKAKLKLIFKPILQIDSQTHVNSHKNFEIPQEFKRNSILNP